MGKRFDLFFAAYVEAALWSTTDNQKDCPKCRGEGHVTSPARAEDMGVGEKFSSVTCEDCNGVGRVEDESGGDPLDKNYDESDLSEECRAQMEADCKSFLKNHGVPDYATASHSRGGDTNPALAGHDFWLTRNGHGAGFWDRGFPQEIEDKYTNAAKSYGSFDLYVGDDGQIHGG